MNTGRADLGRAKAISPRRAPSGATGDHREVLRQRQTIVQDRAMAGGRLETILARYGYRVPGEVFDAENLQKIEGMWLGAGDDFVMRDLVCEIRSQNDRIANFDAAIMGFTGANPDVELIMSMAGFDTPSALLLALEIGDVERFPTPSHLVSWAGLCPAVRGYGNAAWHGRMKDGNKRVRTMMMQISLVAIRHDEHLRAVFERASRRHATKVAMSHVAHKMLTIIWHMLKRRERYNNAEPEHPKTDSAKNWPN